MDRRRRVPERARTARVWLRARRGADRASHRRHLRIAAPRPSPWPSTPGEEGTVDKPAGGPYVVAELERSNHELRIGLLTDALPDRALGKVVEWVARTGLIRDLEIGVGGYSPAPHCRPSELVGHAGAAAAWRKPIDDAGLGISALNVSGNPLHPNPDEARRHDADL